MADAWQLFVYFLEHDNEQFRTTGVIQLKCRDMCFEIHFANQPKD